MRAEFGAWSDERVGLWLSGRDMSTWKFGCGSQISAHCIPVKISLDVLPRSASPRITG